MEKALIAMSGGVDSSVAAYIMKNKGYECEGGIMRLHHGNDLGEENAPSCCTTKDIEDAKDIAKKLGIKLTVFDYVADFEKTIIDKFVRTYESGGTPNPCIDCNKHMKFDKLLDVAKEQGDSYIVTGHYAQVFFDEKKGRYILKKAKNLDKDQSYVLYTLSQEQLSHIKFPLGGLSKDEVREIAKSQGFDNADKKDSQDICFLPNGDYAGFLQEYRGREYPHGNFVDKDGNILGEHKGIIRYTIGQRKGLGIASTAPLFVTKIDPIKNEVTLSHGEDLFSKEIIISDVNLISVAAIDGEMRVKAKIRYGQKEQPAIIKRDDKEGSRENIRLIFDEPQRAATIGQSAVFYDGDVVVGGGVITKVIG